MNVSNQSYKLSASELIYEDNRIRPWDWVLIIGSLLAPMTGFRISKVGPAELLCFIWALRFFSPKIRLNEFNIFFFTFLSSMFIGTIMCLYVAPSELVMNSWLSWIFLAYITCTLYRVICHNELAYNEKVFDTICHLSVLWYMLLYIFSITISRTLLGAPLWYYYRYSGGGTNPHQLATMLCGLAFWFLRQVKLKRNAFLNILCFIIVVFLINETKSSTGIASVFIGVVTFMFVFTFSNIEDRRKRTAIIIIELLAVLLVIISFSNILYSIIYKWVASDSNGLGRFYLWASVKQMALKSPIFGLGPGAHAVSFGGNAKEFHNSYIEIYAAGGIVGFFALILFSLRYAKTTIKGEVYFLPIMASVYMYSVAGFAFRRLAFWVIMAFTYTIAKQLAQ